METSGGAGFTEEKQAHPSCYLLHCSPDSLSGNETRVPIRCKNTSKFSIAFKISHQQGTSKTEAGEGSG